MAFKTIETQEELDAIIEERIKRERESRDKKFEGYLSPEDFKKKTAETVKEIETLKSTISDQKTKHDELTKANKELESKVAKYETDSVKTRVALELGLPYEIAGRLSGTTEEEIKQDAESMLKIFDVRTPAQPRRAEPNEGGNANDSGYHSMLSGLLGKEE